MDVANENPVGIGRPAEDFQFNNGDPILNPTQTGTNVLTYPSDDTFWSNGYTVKSDALMGTAALVDEPTGAGHAVLFAYNPLFRAYNDNGIHLIANALLYPAARDRLGAAADGGTADRRGRLRAAAQKVEEPANLGGEWRPITIQVADADQARTEAVIRKYTDTATSAKADGSTYITIPNPEGLSAEEHPFLREHGPGTGPHRRPAALGRGLITLSR